MISVQMLAATQFTAADIVTVISEEYTKSCMMRRNRYQVDNADILLAAYDGQPGGTAMTVDMARRDGVRLIVIPPIVTRSARPSASLPQAVGFG